MTRLQCKLMLNLVVLLALVFVGIYQFNENKSKAFQVSVLQRMALESSLMLVNQHESGLVGKQFVEFSLDDTNGKVWSLGQIEAPIKLIIYFKTTDCGSCLREYRLWKDISSKYSSKEVAVIGISADLEQNQIVDFIEQKKINFPVLLDPSNFIKRAMGLVHTPLRITLDRNNRVLQIVRSNGELYEMRAYRAYLAELIRESEKSNVPEGKQN